MAKAFVVKLQAFEAAVFGAPVWRVEIIGEPTPAASAELTDKARNEGVALMSARLPADAATGEALRQAGFRLIERLLTFRRDIPAKLPPVPGVASAQSNDAEACAIIGAAAFSFDRFHADSQLPNSSADEIKGRWARNGVNGRADAALVVREDGAIAGLNLCMRQGADAVIDLIAVDRRWQGRGLGRKLVEGALAHYAGAARVLWVSTQETNMASIALYRGAGFALHHSAHTWHWTP